MDQFKQRKGLTNFVFLKVADKVPPAVWGEEGNFGPGFLNPAFTEEEQAVVEGFPKFQGRVRFGDGDQLRRFGKWARSFLHGGKNALPDVI